MVALGSAMLFGMSTPLAKILVGSVPPLILAGLLYAGSGLGLALTLAGRRLWRPRRESLISLPRRGEWLWLAGAIVFGGVAGPVALMYGLVTSAASTASLLLNLEAVLTALLAWSLFRRLHLTEQHGLHAHERQEHTHAHSHDAHHQHFHPTTGRHRTAQSPHVHMPLVHVHAPSRRASQASTLTTGRPWRLP
jgi:hypothetical protein